jgi:arginine utilization protein RocB
VKVFTMSAADHLNDDSDRWQSEQQQITDTVQEILARRVLIEQAKGMIMFVYGLDADAAFEVLRKQSQDHNVKLRLVAEQVLKDLVGLSRAKGPARRLAFDGLMLTAHQRIANSADRQLDGERKTGVPMTDLG